MSFTALFVYTRLMFAKSYPVITEIAGSTHYDNCFFTSSNEYLVPSSVSLCSWIVSLSCKSSISLSVNSLNIASKACIINILLKLFFFMTWKNRFSFSRRELKADIISNAESQIKEVLFSDSVVFASESGVKEKREVEMIICISCCRRENKCSVAGA